MPLTKEPQLGEAIERLCQFIQRELLPAAAKFLGTDGYREAEALKTYFEAVNELEVQHEIDLAEAWKECIEDAERWRKNPFVIWQDSTTPQAILSFLSLVSEFQEQSFEIPEMCRRADIIANELATRGETEARGTFELPEDTDEAVEMVNALDGIGEAFRGMSQLRLVTGTFRQRLFALAERLRMAALSLGEGLPSEPDSDDERGSRASSEDIDINELFSDL